MDTTYRLTQTGPEVQQALDQVNPIETAIVTLNEGKVDKEEGKGLSHNDFTDAEKQKLADLPTEATLNQELETKQNVIDDLQSIRSGATAGAQAAPQATTYTKTEVDAAIADFITRTVNNLTNYYLKTETYTQAEVQQLIAAVKQFRYQSVAELPTAGADTMGIIYLVPSSNPKTENMKDEYITVSTTIEQQVTTYAWEQIGSTTVDLSGYYTSAQTDASITAALNTALASYSTTAQMNSAIAAALAPYYTKTEIVALLAGKQDVISDLATIRSQAATAAPQATTYTKTEVDAAIADFITRTVNNLTNYYLKTETYTQAEVQQLIAAVKQFRYQSVAELPPAGADTMGIIYLVPSSNPKTENVKDEYITVSTTNEQQVTTYAWEQIGSTAVDLSGYYTSSQTDSAINSALNTALANYSTTTEMGTAISTALASYYTKAEADTLLSGKLGTSETAVSATKLQTSRTLWGHFFDGTADVNGDLSEVGSLAMNGVLSGARGEIKNWNQLADIYNMTRQSDITEIVINTYDIDIYYSGDGVCFFRSGVLAGHKYIYYGRFVSKNGSLKVSLSNSINWAYSYQELTDNVVFQTQLLTANSDATQSFYIYANETTSGNILNARLMLFDLTAMFGAGLEPTTATEFANRLGYASIDDVPYIPFTETPVPLTDAMAVGGDLVIREKICSLVRPININGIVFTDEALSGLSELFATGIGDLDVADKNGNVVVRLENGHLITRLFQSEKTANYCFPVSEATWQTIGDSITWYDEHPNANLSKGYQTYVREKMKFTSISNIGVNASTAITWASNYLTSISAHDIYTIFLGVNDWGNNTQLGTLADYIAYSSGTASTFYAAYKAIVKKIRSVNQNALILTVTPRHSYDFNGFLPATSETANSAGVKLSDIANAIIEISRYEGFPVVDLFYESGLTDANVAAYSIDSALHPNDAGMNLIANMIIEKLKKYYI